MSDTKKIHGSLDEIVEAVKVKLTFVLWTEVEEQELRTALERFVVEDGECIIHSTDFHGVCFKCGKDTTTPKKGGEDEA